MIHSYFKITPTLLALCLLSIGCVSKKKHLATLETQKKTNEGVVNDWQKRYNEKRTDLNSSEEKNRTLELNLAERKGENNILVGLRNELQLQIESMESQMNNVSSSSQTVENNLRKDIKNQDSKIANLKKKLKAVNAVFEKNQDLMKRISGDLSLEMQSMELNSAEVTTRLDKVILILPTDLLFRRKSTSRLIDSGKTLLEKISTILNRYPQTLVNVVGHTDNSAADVKKYKDNWNFSSLQAATVVRSLINVYDMNTSQLSAIGKGEFEPRTSNSTREGKAMNRRIEFIIFQPVEDLAKKIKGITEEK